MRKFWIIGLVLVLGVSLIGMFGCLSERPREDKIDTDNIPGVVEGMCVSETDFAYCVQERGEEYYGFGKAFYAHSEPSIYESYVLIKDAFVILKNYPRYNYDGTLLGFPCKHYPEVKVSLPYTIIMQETPAEKEINAKDKLIF